MGVSAEKNNFTAIRSIAAAITSHCFYFQMSSVNTSCLKWKARRLKNHFLCPKDSDFRSSFFGLQKKFFGRGLVAESATEGAAQIIFKFLAKKKLPLQTAQFLFH